MKLCNSYSFSLQLKLCQDITYYKKTTKLHNLNDIIDKFLISFIKKNISYTTEQSTKGRPHKGKILKDINKYTSYPFSLKKLTILKIKKYKKEGNDPDLDKNLEEHLKLIVPIREVR